MYNNNLYNSERKEMANLASISNVEGVWFLFSSEAACCIETYQ